MNREYLTNCPLVFAAPVPGLRFSYAKDYIKLKSWRSAKHDEEKAMVCTSMLNTIISTCQPFQILWPFCFLFLLQGP